MREISKKTGGYLAYAVSGTNTISFTIDFRQANTKGLLGFAVERIDHKKGERKFINGYKVFKKLIPDPKPDDAVSTYTHPVQSFFWDDFTAYPNTEYTYLFYPLKGSPKNLDRTAKPIELSICTEPLFSKKKHDIFFNRGIASSQAYRRKFHNLKPDEINSEGLRKQALEWLSRSLDDAILKFINDSKKGETLLCCFYEFRYRPVVDALANAIKSGVNVKIIIDAKNKITKDKAGKRVPAFPRQENLDTIKAAKLSMNNIIKREASVNAIQHNKFMVRLDKAKVPIEVWTGSTNISMGGIHGQTNVGHWVRDKKVAQIYSDYWKILSKDPGGKTGDDKKEIQKKNKDLKNSVEGLQANITFNSWNDIPTGITPVFSPRSGAAILETYVKMFDSAQDVACITLAFGINELFKDHVADNTSVGPLSYFLLEKEDKPKKNAKRPFVFIGAKQNAYKAWGAYLPDDKLQGWTKEVSTRSLKLNLHVAFIHSKFLLIDPLSSDPIVVTGSANFSKASTNSNDENMIIIRGDTRVADIYYTEFNRLFNHYYFRAVYNNLKKNKRVTTASIFLDETGEWLKKYQQGSFRFKKMERLSKMEK
jgi:phosphatidylserine/phosphatidylglycerophosphate/cardiolipin synthase-like enzyme